MKEEKIYYKFNTLAVGTEILAITLAIIPIPFVFYYLAINHVSVVIVLISSALTPIIIGFCFMYKAEYWIDDEKLVEKLTPMFILTPFLRKRNRTYEWVNVEYYEEGFLYSEYFNDRHYLRLKFKNIKRRIIIAERFRNEKLNPFYTFLEFYEKRVLKKYKVENRKPKFNTEAVMKVLGIIRYWIAIVFFVAMFVLTLFYVFSVLFPSIVGDFKPKRLGDPFTWAILILGSILCIRYVFLPRKK